MSIPSGRPPPTFSSSSCAARPAVLFARRMLLKTFRPPVNPNSLRTGPLTITSGAGKVRGRLYAVDVQPLVAQRPHQRDQNAHHLRRTARHHGVGRNLLDRSIAVAGWDLADDFFRIMRGCREHTLHALRRRWNHRQRLAERFPAVLERVLLLRPELSGWRVPRAPDEVTTARPFRPPRPVPGVRDAQPGLLAGAPS